ncbi:hypothetical protein [Rhizobium sp. EC-SD404]|uniref:hypothetical protein n=1 Tax=Rhizobium sp. EC-SD404 TaxID=2038389 RepID=UPI00125C1645|nr:hypothetical protein [Rhizobium sp. EC-SD404]VVT31894.1 hypothetical protein RHIZ404_230424 [Rhizobium sp. EC-SD404]
MEIADRLYKLVLDEAVPTAAEVLEVKLLMKKLCMGQTERKAERSFRLVHSAYLNLQMARMCNDQDLLNASLEDFRSALKVVTSDSEPAEPASRQAEQHRSPPV